MQSVKDLFGKRIKELRKARNLTQEQLAELVDIDTRNIIKIENSETFPRVKTLDKLLEVFQISASEINGTSGKFRPPSKKDFSKAGGRRGTYKINL